ncbi:MULTISPECIES: CheR family methyltransferase [Giesbergeria]|uniref:CheR family methyltransferase n=1 Tax=Giesbergeria sinuosa TaxID=80883 RepID=A0ABV9QFR5_9BURK
MSPLVDLAPFKVLIHERCGLGFASEGDDYKLRQAILARTQSLRLRADAYFLHLGFNHGEFQELVNLLTINETYFFREPEQLRFVVDRVVPRLVARHAAYPIRILSAGCSSGEEPYSLAIALQEKYGPIAAEMFSIHAADIDSAMVEKARQGVFSDFSFRGVAPEIRQRYFQKSAAGYTLAAEIRQRVTFRLLNLVQPERPLTLTDFHVILFRNVSIYFDTATRRRIQQHLAEMLKPDGLLFTGIAETLANDLQVFQLVEEEGTFYFSKDKTPPLPSAPAPRTPSPLAATSSLLTPKPPARAPTASTPTTPAQKPYTPPAPDSQALRRLVAGQHYDQALPQLDTAIATAPQNPALLLLKALVLLERRQFSDATALAQQVLAQDHWSIDASFLLGQIARNQQQMDEAIRWFKQAAYAHHACWPAHYYLADLYRQRGDVQLARRAYRAVLQLLDDPSTNHGIGHIPLALPSSEIRKLCERHLATLVGERR